MATAGGVVLIQLAVADGHRSMCVWVAVDVEDEDVTRLTAVVALARFVPSFVQQGTVELRHPAKIVAVVVGVTGQARERTSGVRSHGGKLRATIVRIPATVAVGPVDRSTGIVATGSGAWSADTALDVQRTRAIASQGVTTATRALASGHALAVARGGVAIVVRAASDVRGT